MEKQDKHVSPIEYWENRVKLNRVMRDRCKPKSKEWKKYDKLLSFGELYLKMWKK